MSALGSIQGLRYALHVGPSFQFWSIANHYFYLRPTRLPAKRKPPSLLRKRLRGKRVGLIVCGANIYVAKYLQLMDRGCAIAKAARLSADEPAFVDGLSWADLLKLPQMSCQACWVC